MDASHSGIPLRKSVVIMNQSGQTERSTWGWVRHGIAIGICLMGWAVPSGVAKDATNHWAFLPVRPMVPPALPGDWKRWVQNPIDQFIAARLDSHGLRPSPAATRVTLMRRMAYDVTGLPPEAALALEFESGGSPEAMARLVDQLLSSPRYGERWGRHWLDVARFSDTKGYVYGDREEGRFVHSSTYRDWVVRVLNEDMPYDRFVALQVAADQMGGDPRDLAAMGYLTLGRRFLGVIHDIIDDRLDVVLRGMQGLTITCARCHDHKFDPIPIRDYYSLYGVFHGSIEKAAPIVAAPAEAQESLAFRRELDKREAALAGNFRKKCLEFSDRVRAQSRRYLEAVPDADKLPTEEFYVIRSADDLNPTFVRRWQDYLYRQTRAFHPVFEPWRQFMSLPDSEFHSRAGSVVEWIGRESRSRGGSLNERVSAVFAKVPTSKLEVASRYGELFASVHGARQATGKATAASAGESDDENARDADWKELEAVLYGLDSPVLVPDVPMSEAEWFFDESSRVELSKLQKDIDGLLIDHPGATPHAVVLVDKAEQRHPRVFVRGNPAVKGEEVPRQFLGFLSGSQPRPFIHGSGRLELARAIADPANPLTARVVVNRVWAHYFGTGLVSTPSDFGTRADPPSHPELLDWLAGWFVSEGWSLKRLHRLILTSAAYQQSAVTEPWVDSPTVLNSGWHRAVEVDPLNRLLWAYPRRRLDFEELRDSLLRASGELNLRVGGRSEDLTDPVPTLRRALYGRIDRQFLPGLFRTFDVANPDVHVATRPETIVPQQALYLMNNRFLAARARAVVARVGGEISVSLPTAESRVQDVYQAIYQRPATPDQVFAALEFLRDAQSERSPGPPTRPKTDWQYGVGDYDAATQRLRTFAELPFYAEKAWQGGEAWPDSLLGWAQLTSEGGHAGNDLAHAVVRRWRAPRAGTVTVFGAAFHDHQEGDGIRLRVISSRLGLLREELLHFGGCDLGLESVAIQAGDTLDFVVDIRETLNNDDFRWAPVIWYHGQESLRWDARRDFLGWPATPIALMSPWEQLAQALFLGNEFVFLD